MQRVAPQVERARGELCVQVRALRVIDIDHGRLQAGRVEQRSLGLPVGLHAAVVVQVVLGEIGEQSHANLAAIQTVLDDADGRCLDGAGREALVGVAAEHALQQHRVRRGHARRLQRRRYAHAQGAHQRTAGASLERHLGQRMGQPPGCGGLAIGAGHGQHVELATGMSKPLVGNQSRRGLQILESGNTVAAQVKGLQAFGLHQHGGSSLLQSLAHVGSAISGCSGPGDKSIACLDLAAIGLQVTLHTAAQPGNGLGCIVQDLNLGAHSTGSSAGAATI
ncbi:hypothetical protein SDC9_154422 [bioreactor metagenome]|uniref:Uncharacterized protein n=1 Tax=bioreactor metagenome TaxID=1076179 RepID=A0A645F0F2_9ZZZZ